MNIVRPPNAALQHAAVPHRRTVRDRDVVHPDRLHVTADTALLDVDDAARSNLERVLGLTRRFQ